MIYEMEDKMSFADYMQDDGVDRYLDQCVQETCSGEPWNAELMFETILGMAAKDCVTITDQDEVDYGKEFWEYRQSWSM